MNKVFIFAGTHEQAKKLARWHDMAQSEWTYVSDPYRLFGQRQQTMWLYGSWLEHPACVDVLDKARAAQFRIFAIKDDMHFGGLS